MVFTSILESSLFHFSFVSSLILLKSQCGISAVKFLNAPLVLTGDNANLMLIFSFYSVLKLK